MASGSSAVPGGAMAGVRTAKCNFCQRAYSGEVVAKSLKCGHAVCSLCLTQYFKEGQIVCPMCRKISTAQSLDEFATNFELQNLIDQLNQVQISTANEPAPVAAPRPGAVKLEPRHITIKVMDQDGARIEFKMNYDAKLGRMMNQYAARKGVPVETLKFSCDGVTVKPEHTPEFFELDEGDIIDVLQFEEGGCHCNK